MVLNFQLYEDGLPGLGVIVKSALMQTCLLIAIACVLVAVGGPDFLDDSLGSALLTVAAIIIEGFVSYALYKFRGGSKKLLSLPGGPAFKMLAWRFGHELRTVWLGNATCHDTCEDHLFEVQRCPFSREKDCWQCLYMVQVADTIRDGYVPVATTTNVTAWRCRALSSWSARIWQRYYGSGSSELPEEMAVFGSLLPGGWGNGTFPSGRLYGCDRVARRHEDTGMPLGVGCRWERRFLHTLPEEVLVVSAPPSYFALCSFPLACALKCFWVVVFCYLCAVAWEAFTDANWIYQRCMPMAKTPLSDIHVELRPCPFTGWLLTTGGFAGAALVSAGVLRVQASLRGQMRPPQMDERYMRRGEAGIPLLSC